MLLVLTLTLFSFFFLSRLFEISILDKTGFQVQIADLNLNSAQERSKVQYMEPRREGSAGNKKGGTGQRDGYDSQNHKVHI
jgi:hypothetical protein